MAGARTENKIFLAGTRLSRRSARNKSFLVFANMSVGDRSDLQATPTEVNDLRSEVRADGDGESIIVSFGYWVRLGYVPDFCENIDRASETLGFAAGLGLLR